MDLEAKINQRLSLFTGINYQFDLVKGSASWLDEDMGDNELKALLVKFGLGIEL